MSSPTSALAVANFFVKKGVEEGVELTQLKLQKLTYYAFAWWAAFVEGRLYDEPIEAWRHGPVISKLWARFRAYGRSHIDGVASDVAYVAGKLTTTVPEVNDPQVIALLEDVWRKYARFDAIQLSNMTHDEDEPWAAIRTREPLDSRPEISFELIRDMFKRKLEA